MIQEILYLLLKLNPKAPKLLSQNNINPRNGGLFRECARQAIRTIESGSEVESLYPSPRTTFRKKRFIFTHGVLFWVLRGLSSVISRKMDTSCSGLHAGSGFLKTD